MGANVLATQGARASATMILCWTGIIRSVCPITMTSQWARWRLKSPASRLCTQPFIRAQIKVNIKAPRHWPLCGEFTGTGEIPAQMASNAENVSIWCREHGLSWSIQSVCPPTRPKRRYRSNSLRISAISLTFGGMMHNTMEQITLLMLGQLLRVPRNFEIFHDRLFWPGLRDDVTL